MNIHTMIFWGVKPCSLVGGYQHFTGAYCLYLHPANKCSMLLLNICTYLLNYTLSHPSSPTQNISHVAENLKLEGQMAFKPKISTDNKFVTME
jgi:hypothetical protein